MGISNYTLNRLYQSIKDELLNSKIEKIINISDNSYLFSLYKEGKTKNLLLSLDPSLPLICLSSNYRIGNINPSNNNTNMLRKYFDHGTIISTSKVENDRIIIFEVKKWSPSYQIIHSYLIFELFPLSPNIIIVDPNYKILDCFKHSDSLDSKHPVYRGLQYKFPLATDKYFDINSSLEDLKGKINRSEYRYLESLNENDFKNALFNIINEKDFYIYNKDVSSLKINQNANKVNQEELFESIIYQKIYENKEDKFSNIYKLVEQKIKSLNKKLLNLEKDKDRFVDAEDNLNKGNLLYLGNETYKKGDSQIIINDIKIKLDPRFDLNQNAQKYFKLYKKSKSGLLQIEIQKENTIKELDYFLRINASLKFASSSDMNEIMLDLYEHGYLKDKKIAVKNNKKPGNKKYSPHIIKVNDQLKIGYGLSSYQNEELTFEMARKSDTYLHIKDFHGPHVIIFKDNPNEDELLLAAEIALFFSDKTAGEVYYTLRQNVKKVPGIRGLTTMSTYSIIVINNIREATIKLLKNYL